MIKQIYDAVCTNWKIFVVTYVFGFIMGVLLFA